MILHHLMYPKYSISLFSINFLIDHNLNLMDLDQMNQLIEIWHHEIEYEFLLQLLQYSITPLSATNLDNIKNIGFAGKFVGIKKFKLTPDPFTIKVFLSICNI